MRQWSGDTARFRIVLIDDETLLCQTVQDILENSAVEVVLCPSPASALSFVQQTKPDLVLLDIYLEGHNGLDILATLKQHSELKHIPVMMLTANAQQEMVERSILLGATDYLAKPFTVSYFKSKLANHLGADVFSSSNPSVLPPAPSPQDHQAYIRVLEPDLSLQKLLKAVLVEQGYHVECLPSIPQTPIDKGKPHLVILNRHLLDAPLYLQKCQEHGIPVVYWQDLERSSATHPFSIRHLVEEVKRTLSKETF